jgi:hypothetical protein
MNQKNQKNNAWLGVSTMCADAVWWPHAAEKYIGAVIVTTMPKRMKWTGTP